MYANVLVLINLRIRMAIDGTSWVTWSQLNAIRSQWPQICFVDNGLLLEHLDYGKDKKGEHLITYKHKD